MKSTIVIRAPLFSLSGYGAHARDIVFALWDSRKYNIIGVPTGWGNTSTTDNIPRERFEILSFICNNKVQGSDFCFVHVGVPQEFQRAGSKSIGITAGVEADRLPWGWMERCNQVDAVIVPSTFVRNLFVNGGVTVPVHVVGEGVDIRIFNPSVSCNLPLEFETEFNFLTGGQWIGNDPESDRKGLGKLIRWFCETFSDNKEVGLVVKTMMNNISTPDFEFVKQRIDNIKQGKPFPKIYLLHGDMSETQMSQLYRHPKIKAFVSCTSGEGWGRMVAEAVASDLPVLITGWSGHMDFLHKDFVTLFDFNLSPIPKTSFMPGILEPGMRWASVEESDVKRKLRRCVDNYSVAQERAQKMGEIFRKTWNSSNTSAKLVEVFDTIIKPRSPFVVPRVSVKTV